jgi:putative hemolysin
MRDLFIIFGCWTISFLYNGIEAGLMAVDPVRLRHHVKLNRAAAVRLDRLLRTPGRVLATVLLVTNFADILALLLLTRRLVARFGTAGFALVVVIALPIYLFILNVLPKSLFRRFPFRALSPLAGLLELGTKVLSPVLAIGAALGGLFLPQQTKRARLFAAREELKQITAQSEREGSITSTERAMIHNVVDFQNVTARDVMKPLSQVAAETECFDCGSFRSQSRQRLGASARCRREGRHDWFDQRARHFARQGRAAINRPLFAQNGNSPGN